METTPPIITVSHNNYHYLNFMINQIKTTPGMPPQIIIMDNQSTDPKTVQYLQELECKDHDVMIIYNQTNYGPRINPMNHQELYHSLPLQFLITDPDILFNPSLPPNFVHIMSQISEFYGAEKVGFALDISDPDSLYDIPNYFMGKSIVEWESQFWQNPIEPLWNIGNGVTIPLYRAEIDTTFCLVNKRYENSGVHIRIGGSLFVAKHLPWIRHNPILNQDVLYDMARNQGADSTMAPHILREKK